MMLALSQNIVEAHSETLAGNWSIRDSGRMFELFGKTAGIIGTGAIGKETAKLCAALGMNVITCNSRSTREELETLLRVSDVVSLHVPLTDKTRGMISGRELGIMKKSAILINCARGGVVDEKALAEALNDGVIYGAVLLFLTVRNGLMLRTKMFFAAAIWPFVIKKVCNDR